MKDFINKRINLNTIEFWAVTTIFVFAVFFLVTDAVRIDWRPGRGYHENISIPFYQFFICKLIRYILFYGAFLLLNFRVVPNLIKREGLFLNIALIIITFIASGLVFGITDTYLKSYLFNEYKTKQDAYNFIFQNSFLYASWLLLLFGFYSVIKYIGLYLLAHSEAIQSKYRIMAPGVLTAFMLWMISIFCLLIGNADRGITAVWGLVVPFAIAIYWYSFYSLLPKSMIRKKPFRSYIGRIILLLLISIIPATFLVMLMIRDDGAAVAISSFNAAFHLFITAPLSWVIFKRYTKGKEEVYVLKRELGQSHASFDFLRSQINPHFLFNALNTIYGTAIQEGAERTSQGIQMLGDMMRFMLQENMQDKISLAREIEYLNNYISLQKLRTDPDPGIRIQTEIEQPVSTIQVAPMLLIPFVENAFKHGISFREPSHIKITLAVKDGSLLFDVYNSRHRRTENDPEKGKSGIGLHNVKQRLQLLYPSKHELFIRETEKDYFVHLTIRLA